MLRELNHRVKNNLQLLLSMINLHRSQGEASPEAILDATVHRLRTIANVHEQLCISDRQTEINLPDYLLSLGEGILTTCSESPLFIYNTNPEEVLVSIGKAIPVGLIVNEVILNAAKHAFPSVENPALQLDCYGDEHDTTIVVVDNGIGIGGKGGLEEVGFGTLLIKSLTDQIGGTSSWASPESGGTIFRLNLPA